MDDSKIRRAVERAVTDAGSSGMWHRVLGLFPEVEGGDMDPLWSHHFDMNAARAAALWAELNHPDQAFRERVVDAVREEDPHFDDRGSSEPLPGPLSPPKEWSPRGSRGLRDLASRYQRGIGLMLEDFFRSLEGDFRAETEYPLEDADLARFEGCLRAFFLRWLEYNHPDEDAVGALHQALLTQDPYLRHRCDVEGA